MQEVNYSAAKSGARIGGSTYQAARDVSAIVANHFIHHIETARQLGEQDLALAPDASVIETIIDVAFWASLHKEEGLSPKISLAFLAPDDAVEPLLFSKRLPFTPATLAKLGPGVERPGIHLGVWFENGELFLWGCTRQVSSFCFVLDVSEPGLLVIKHKRIGGFGKFANVAVLKGDQVKLIDEQSASLPDCPALLTSLLGFTSVYAWSDSVNVLVQLAASMRAHGRGGTLLVVPSGDREWRRSIVNPIQYLIDPAFTGLSDLIREELNERKETAWQEKLRKEIDALAGLTAVDGATVISDQYELYAFGAKIGRPDGNPTVEQIVVTEPVIGGEAIIMHPSQKGGTRHLSAAQFVHDQRNALALVASQDGAFTIFTWSPCESTVHAHRIDALLL